MIEKPIIKEMEEFSKKIPPYEWYDNEDVPQEFIDFQEDILTSSDPFWYALNNGHINIQLITDDNLEDLSHKDLMRIEKIVTDFGIEF